MTWIAIGIGGAVGAMGRHALTHLAHAHWPGSRFPAGTVVVNLTGCLVIGTLAGLIAAGRAPLPAYWREFVFVGLLGGFTTFSTFGLDTFLLGRTHSLGYAALNVALHVIGGLTAVWLGYRLALAGH